MFYRIPVRVNILSLFLYVSLVLFLWLVFFLYVCFVLLCLFLFFLDGLFSNEKERVRIWEEEEMEIWKEMGEGETNQNILSEKNLFSIKNKIEKITEKIKN